jgi:hypothetical protein
MESFFSHILPIFPLNNAYFFFHDHLYNHRALELENILEILYSSHFVMASLSVVSDLKTVFLYTSAIVWI